MKLFGFEINRERKPENFQSFTLPGSNETVTNVPATGGTLGFTLDLDGTVKTESELIAKYRDLAFHPEVDSAIDDIVNDAIITDDINKEVVTIDLSKLELPDNIKFVIEQEFKHILNLLNFNKKGYEIFRSWYIDGRKYYHIIIDEKAPQNGILKLFEVNALKLRKIREIAQVPSEDGGTMQNVVNEYYLYNDSGFTNNATTSFFNVTAGMNATRVSTDAILVATSGLMNDNSTMVLSYLHPAIRPLNQLRMLEDAAVIYRLVRAPARRVFYIDVGGLPKAKAEQYVKDMMTMHKNKVSYDMSSGELRDQRRFLTMTEDYWLPRREGQGTEIDTLAEGQNLSEMNDVEYFVNKLYKALKVPLTRIDPSQGFNLGRPTEITRDELKFTKYISRLQLQFSTLFLKALEKQLILRQVIAPEEWEQLEPNIHFKYATDQYFEDLKNAELLRDKAQTTEALMPFVDQFFSRRFVWRNVWNQTDEDIEETMAEIMQDLKTFGPIQPPEEIPEQRSHKLLPAEKLLKEQLERTHDPHKTLNNKNQNLTNEDLI